MSSSSSTSSPLDTLELSNNNNKRPAAAMDEASSTSTAAAAASAASAASAAASASSTTAPHDSLCSNCAKKQKAGDAEQCNLDMAFLRNEQNVLCSISMYLSPTGESVEPPSTLAKCKELRRKLWAVISSNEKEEEKKKKTPVVVVYVESSDASDTRILTIEVADLPGGSVANMEQRIEQVSNSKFEDHNKEVLKFVDTELMPIACMEHCNEMCGRIELEPDQELVDMFFISLYEYEPEPEPESSKEQE